MKTHCQQVMHLDASRGKLRGAAAMAVAGKLADKAAEEGLYDTLIDLGQLYGLMRTIDDELQLYQEALDEVCGDIVHASTPQLEMRLSKILAVMGQLYLRQYNSHITSGGTQASAPLQNVFWRRRSASSAPTREMAWQHRL